MALGRLALLVSLLVGLGTAPLRSQKPEIPRGLLARYSAEGRTVERIDADVAFDWQSGSPDPRLPRGPFHVKWSGRLLVQQDAAHTFHAYVQGDVAVRMAGQEVLSGRRDEPGWVSGPAVSPGPGMQPIEVTFRKTEPQAQLRLFWTSHSFPLEPIPARSFFRSRESDGADVSRMTERGRVLFDAHRCDRCHRRGADPSSPPAPALTRIVPNGADMDRLGSWLLEKVRHAGRASREARMPTFDFTQDEARAVAAFLVHQSKSVELQEMPDPRSRGTRDKPSPKQERRQGEILVRSVGCLACHTVGNLGRVGPYGGGDLTHIGSKRSAEWLFTWLGDPEVLNPDHRMPVFDLTTEERRQLALYLSTLTDEPQAHGQRPVGPPTDRDMIAEGRRLVEAARCAACHRINGIDADPTGLPDLSDGLADGADSCLQKEADRATRRPGYPQLGQEDRKALRSFLRSRTGAPSPPNRFARGRRVLERRSCLACHPRGLAEGLTEVAGSVARHEEALRGQSPVLVPPSLTAIGDKLKDEALARAVSGEQQERRLPWLHVRMPRFDHSEEDKTALLHYLIAHDRIPAGWETPGDRARDESNADPQALIAGHRLVGPKGLNCIACHKIRDYEPRDVAPGTRGSDLWMLGRRMRRDYYLRWTRSPLRIVPETEMPALRQPVPGLLDGNLDAQIAATWEALNDPRFEPPADPSVVEQLLTVHSDEPPRIVRDVFTNPEENGGGYVPRAFAVGLPNGHNVLFDLDRFSLRLWTFGDFARQRTVGKSWYWDMAGIPVMTGFPETCDFALLPTDRGDPEPIRPKRDHGTNGRLIGYRSSERGVKFTYEVGFEIDGAERPLRITERITPVSESGGRTGWNREIVIKTPLPAGQQLLVSRPTPDDTVGSPTIKARNRAGGWKQFPQAPGRWFMPVAAPSSHDGQRRTVLEYRADLRREITFPPSREEPGPPEIERVTSTPGFNGVRLPLKREIMPTALAWTSDGTLAFTSLKGHVYLADDSDGDGIEDRLKPFEEGLAAPFGLIPDGEDLIVSHKPELLRLRDTDGDGRADVRTVFATGWGYNDNYHDWTCGIVRDSQGNLYVGLGSDYAQPDRPKEHSRWRGKVLRIDPEGQIRPVGHSFRYPIGLAINAKDQVFVSDNQGVQNTFNEINYLMQGKHYGVPSRYEENPDAPATPPAVQVPHPWTRSVNGLFFLPNPPPPAAGGEGSAEGADPLRVFAGHGIGCELNERFLVRFTLQQVDDILQGAVYAFSRRDAGTGPDNFLGPLCGAVGPDGSICIGSIHDSGWLSGQNIGDIVRLRPNGDLPNGIRELRAVPEGFQIEFIRAVDPETAASPGNYNISGYTRVWEGGYATPDSGRHTVPVEAVDVSADHRRVVLHVDGLREGYVYDVSCDGLATDSGADLFPATGHYTLHRIPRDR